MYNKINNNNKCITNIKYNTIEFLKLVQLKLVEMIMLQVVKKYFSHIHFTNDLYIICQDYSIVIGNRSE